MAGKVTVGTVYLKVQPDLDGFRRKVEQGAKGLKDVEVDVNPDMDGFRQKVKAATKGMKASVDVDANTKNLIRKTEKALEDVKRKAKNTARLRMDAEFANASADRRIKRFLDKANATSVIKLRVDGLNPSDVSGVRDQVQREVSKKPVNLRFAAPRAQLKKAMEDAQRTLRKQIPGQQRYMQLSLGTSPKDSGSQRKMLSYLDQVRSKIDKLKKPVSTPWEQWDGKKLDTLKVGVGDLDRAVSMLKARTQDSWKLNGLRNGDTSNLSDQLKELHKIDEQFKKLKQRSKETGDATPAGFLNLTKQITKFQKDLEQIDKARGKMMDKWTREAYKPVDYGSNTPDFLRRVSPLGNQVHKRTVREIRKEQLLRNQAVASAVRGYKKVADSASKASQKVSQETSKSIQKVQETSRRAENVVRKSQERIKKAASPIARQIRLANAIDPGNKLDKTLSGKLINLRLKAKEAAKGLDEFKLSAQKASGVSKEVADENSRAAKSFTKVEKAAKKANNSGFGGRRRKGLKSIDEVGTERFAGLTRVGWIVAAIAAIAAPAVQLISGLAASLPALGGAALAALGVTLLGLDGIKEAAKAASPALERAKEAVSGVFETRMTPQFKQLGGLLDNITPQLTDVAEGMSDFSQGLVDGLTSKTGETNIQKLLTNTAGLFSKMKPFAKDFTEGLLEMAGAGSETFPSLADGMNRFGSSFKKNISELASSGQLQAAIQSTYDVVGSLGTNLGKIMRAGIETAPSMAKSLNPLFDGLADGVVGIMPLLSSFSEMVGPVLGTALSEIGDIGERIGPGLSDMFEGLTPGLQGLVSGIGDIGGAVLGPISDFLGGLAPGVGDTLGAVGQGFSELAAGITGLEGQDVTIRGIGDAISDMMSKSMMGAGFGHDLGLNAREVEEGLQMYGNAFTRGITGSFGESGLIRLVANDLLRSAPKRIAGDLDKVTASVEESFRKAEQALQIDLSPQIKALDSTSNLEEIREVISETVNMIQDNLAPSTKIEPEITVNPKIDMAGSLATLADSASGPMADLEATIEQFKVNARAVAGEVGIDITPQINILENATTAEQFSKVAQRIIDQIKLGVDTTPTEIDPNLTVSQSAPVDTTGVTDGVKQQVETDINSALSVVDLDMSSAAASIGSQLGDALGGVDVPLDGLTDSVTSQIDGLVSEVSAKLSEITTAFQTEGDAGSTAFSGAMETMSATSTGIVSGMASTIQSTLSMDLTANGASVGNTFAAGLESTVGRVRNAAAALAAAVDANMPHSPAKEGPLSGKGWVDTSGIAVGREFAAGMLSQVSYVGNAAGQVTGAVRDEFDRFQTNPVSNMESFKRNEVLQPVLESNAKKIADWRKREEERAEKHNERMGKIDGDKSQADKKEEQRVKAREDLAKQSAESYEKLLESLETPDYESIDRSFQGYWMDGYSAALKQSIQDAMSSTNVSGALAQSVKQTTALIRDNIGDHPILAQVEANVDSEAFNWAIHNAIEEAGIHEVPINFAVSNIDQLKTDLGMGDGVISRALDQAIQFDPARNDKRRYEEEKTEVHYHVTDMEEAIRLEQKRERLELMRLPR